MVSQYSDANVHDICKFDKEFLNLLEVDGGFLKKRKYRKFVKSSKEFYAAYVKKCNEYNTYMDFFTPLLWYLVGCGYGYDQSLKYLSEIRNGIIEYLKRTLPESAIIGMEKDFDKSS